MAKEVILEAILEGERVSAEELLAIPGFAAIPKERLEKFPGAIVRRNFDAGSIIVRQREHGTTCFYLLSGTAEIYVEGVSAHGTPRKQSESNRDWFKYFERLTNHMIGAPLPGDSSSLRSQPEVSTIAKRIGEIGPGEIVGELEALNVLKEQKRPRPKFYPRAATVRAQTAVVVLEMLPNYLNTVLYSSPAFKDTLNRKYKRRAIEYAIRSAPVFRDLSEELFDYLCSRAELVDFEPGQVICQRGDEVEFFDLVRVGFVKLAQAFPGGELVLAYLSGNSYFGEMGLMPVLRVRTQSEEPERMVECLVSTIPIGVGRTRVSPDDLAIPFDEFISRGNHAELSAVGNRSKEGNQLKVVLKSGKNPIRFNEQLVDKALVSPGESFVLGQTTFEVEADPLAGKHSATSTAMDFVQLVRIKAEDFARILEDLPQAASAIAEVAQGRRQIAAQLLARVHQVSLEDFLDQDLMQAQNLLLLDLDRCTRCDECVKACIATHPDHVPRLMRDGLRFQNYLVATSCRACMDPLCMTHCPVGAIRRKGSSLDIVIEDWCIGCCNCAQDCPYGAINVTDLGSTLDPFKPGSEGVARKPKAVVCDLCREYPEPNCVRACPHDAAIRIQPNFFFARELAGVPLMVTPQPPPQSEVRAVSSNTKMIPIADELLTAIPRLEVVVGLNDKDPLPSPHSPYFLLRNPGSTSFGREIDNDCVLQNDTVSKNHAIIECHGSRYVLRNLSESNITYVNDQPASELELHPGDLIEMGLVKLKFRLGPRQ
jgi:Fe-S-cluster-containing hydrogenase component 2